MSAIISGLVGAVTAVTICAFAERRQKSVKADNEGWKYLRPGWLIHSIFIGCMFFVALTSYILLNGGSLLPDAEVQNIFLVLLWGGFGATGAHLSWSTYGRSVRRKGNQLHVRQWLSRSSTHQLSDAPAIRKRETRGEYQLKFRTGFKLNISVYMKGSQQLIFHIRKRNGRT